ncbi:MAG: glucokinase [Woeseiaceae bacterium]|nr:glucokinase [Woeseiaceae bacterium]
MARKVLLIGDIGGTNARFALADGAGFADDETLNCADFATADDAIRHYLDGVGAKKPAAICLAVAGPIVDGSVRFTNNPWTIAAVDLKRTFGIDAVRLLNDFEAIAYSVPLLTAADVQTIGLPDPRSLDKQHYTVGVIGPGTGLGAVGLRRFGEHFIPIPGEYGHGGFAPETQVQLDILKVLRERFDRVSSERLVSGQGLENIYRALVKIHGEKRVQLSAPEIFAASIEAGDARATEAVELFFEILGQVAGDFALTLGAKDGIFIAGGIAKRYPDKLANSRFRSGFESKGRHRSLMERVPTQLIVHAQPGLLGASYCVRQMSS